MTTKLTQEGYDNLQNELDELVRIRRPEIAAKLLDVADSKDFEDNPELDVIRFEQSFVEGRIQELNIILANATIISETPNLTKIDIGALIDIREEDGSLLQYRLVSPAEANPLVGKISFQSPLGKAILGKKVGDKVEVQAPDGSFKIEIVGFQ